MNIKVDMFDAIAANKRKTWVLLFIFIALVLVLGYSVGYIMDDPIFGLILAFIFAIIYSMIVFTSGDQIILRMSNAKELPPDDTNYIFNLVETVSLAAGMAQPPKVYIINDPAPNAFAMGKKPEKSVVALTTGIIDKLNREELEGVIAHEVSHIINYDIRVAMVAIALFGVISMLAGFARRHWLYTGHRSSKNKKDSKKDNGVFMIIAIVLIILAPLFAQLLQLAISRKREYLADANAAVLTRNPKALANALRKIVDDDGIPENHNEALDTLYICHPLKKRKSRDNLFSTHPPIQKRIERLMAM